VFFNRENDDIANRIFILTRLKPSTKRIVVSQKNPYSNLVRYFFTKKTVRSKTMASSSLQANHGLSWVGIEGGIINGGVGGAEQIWVVNVNNEIFYKPHIAGNWLAIDGRLSYIAVGAGGHVYGVNSNDDIFYREWASNFEKKRH